MKTILEYINDNLYAELMINESFSSSILREISKQFNDRITKNHEKRGLEKYSSADVTSTFRAVFGKRFGIGWDKITDDDFTKYKKDDEEGLKLVRAICSNRSNHFKGLVILLNDDKNADIKYLGALMSGPCYFSFNSNYTIAGGKYIKPGEALDYLTNEYYLIDLTKFVEDKKIKQRDINKSGAFNIFNDEETREWEYKRILEINKERYKQYVAKVKAQKDADDGMAEKVSEYINKIMEITTKMSKDPMKYAKYEYEVGYLIDLLQDQRRYNPSVKPGKGYYSGKDGLLLVYKEYIKLKLANAKGSSFGFQREDYLKTKEKLDLIFKDIDSKLEKFKEVA